MNRISVNDLAAFAKRVESLLAGANREPHWKPDEAERYMANVAARRRDSRRSLRG